MRSSRTIRFLVFVVSCFTLTAFSSCHAWNDAGIDGSWLPKYIAFHRENRGKPGAKYLVWICSSTARGAHVWVGGGCGGLGDRLRGMAFAMRLASFIDRVFLIHHDAPSDLLEFFTPNLVDWRIDPSWQLRLAKFDDYQGPIDFDLIKEAQQRRDPVPPEQVLMVHTNLDPWLVSPEGIQWHPEMFYESLIARQTTQAIFKMSDKLEADVNTVLADIGIGKDDEYLAVHLRLGGFPGEHDKQVRTSLGEHATHEQLLHAAERCFLRLGHRHGVLCRNSEKLPPMVVITDNTDLRGKVSAGMIKPFIGPKTTAIHIGISMTNTTGAYTSIVDFGILVKAKCLVHTNSGFSIQAHLIGGHSCAAKFDHCRNFDMPLRRFLRGRMLV